MSLPKRQGFTLVEILVVTVIISMLVALLIPAVQISRDRARRAQCMNRQKQLALGVLQHENSAQRFPGYLNKMGTAPLPTAANATRPLPLSWITVLLPHIGREDVWRTWRAQTTSTGLGQTPRMPEVICPSDANLPGQAPTSYVVNCGVQDDNALAIPDTHNNGGTIQRSSALFHNLYGAYNGSQWVTYTEPRVTISRIPDGAAQTLMMAENIQAAVRHQGGPDANWYAPVNACDSATTNVERQFGFVWAWWQGNTIQSPLRINQDREPASLPAIPQAYQYARPSSLHTGVVIVAFADGHQMELNDQIDPATLRHLMVPNDTAVNADFSLPGYTGDPNYAE